RALHDLAQANGIDDLRWLDASVCTQMEPALHAVAGLLSPSTGIIDSHALMLAYQGDAERAGAMIAFGAPVAGGEVASSGFRLDVGGSESMRLTCDLFVNAAGLHAPQLARRVTGIPAASIPRSFLCKGSYYTLAG